MSTSYQQRLGFYKGDRYIHHLGEENARRTSVFKSLSNKRERDDNKIKSQMCSNLPNCKFGDKCRFAHSKDELRKPVCKFGEMCRFKATCNFDHSPRKQEAPSKSAETLIKATATEKPKQNKHEKPPIAPREKFIIELEDSDEECEEKEQNEHEEDELLPTPDEEEKVSNAAQNPMLRSILEALNKLCMSDDEIEEQAMKKIAEEARTADIAKKTAVDEAQNIVIQQAIRQPCGVLFPDVAPTEISNIKENEEKESIAPKPAENTLEKSFNEDPIVHCPEEFLSGDEDFPFLHDHVEAKEMILADVFNDEQGPTYQDDFIYPQLDESFDNFTIGPSLCEFLDKEENKELKEYVLNQQHQLEIQQQRLGEQQTIINAQSELLCTPSIPLIVSPSLFYFIQQCGF